MNIGCACVCVGYVCAILITNYKSVTTKNFSNGKVENGFPNTDKRRRRTSDGTKVRKERERAREYGNVEC